MTASQSEAKDDAGVEVGVCGVVFVVPGDEDGQYGNLWWVPNLPGFFNALGSFGQMIYVSRQRGLVIVFTAYMQNDVAKNQLEQLIHDYVLPASE